MIASFTSGWWRLVSLAVLCVLPEQPLENVEEISSFQADVAVAADGLMTVTETIDVVAGHHEIKRGIYRDIPVWFGGGPLGMPVRIPLEIVRIECDGRPAPYHTDDQGSFARVSIGDTDVMVPRGPHTYTIEYRTRQLRSYADHDEVYWNATGNAWAFPIAKARASITFPDGVPGDSIRPEAYVGVVGSKNQRVLSLEEALAELGDEVRNRGRIS